MHICMRTLRRWRRWWLETFVQTPFWKVHRGRFHPPAHTGELPGSLLSRFSGKVLADRLILLLRFLCPLSTNGGYAMGV